MLTHIRDQSDLQRGVEALCELDAILLPVIAKLPEIPLRLRKPGFEGLADIITAQQVSRASATAIFDRLTSVITPFDAEMFLAAGEAPLIEAGLSRAKQKTLTGLATEITEGRLDLDALCLFPVDEAMEKLTALSGIGPWTAEVYLMFCAGHVDIFPAGDIALQHAMADIDRLEARPDAKSTRIIAQRWSPYRSVAARVLYAHYADIKGRNAVP